MKQSFCFSIILHITIILFFIINFNVVDHYAEKTSSPILHTYLYYKKSNLNNKLLTKENSSSTNKSITQQLIKKNHDTNTKETQVKTANSPSNLIYAKNVTKNDISELARKLHDLIQENIARPNEIRDLMKNKNIEVSFTLLPEGNITDIQITKSSDINILDNLAINAIQSIQPVKFAKSFIQEKEQFKINIIFSS